MIEKNHFVNAVAKRLSKYFPLYQICTKKSIFCPISQSIWIFCLAHCNRITGFFGLVCSSIRSTPATRSHDEFIMFSFYDDCGRHSLRYRFKDNYRPSWMKLKATIRFMIKQWNFALFFFVCFVSEILIKWKMETKLDVRWDFYFQIGSCAPLHIAT